jgi:hypothetical protein
VTKIWICEGSTPVVDADGRPRQNGWRKNVNLAVVTDTLQHAWELAEERYPEIVFHKVFVDRQFHDLIIDKRES